MHSNTDLPYIPCWNDILLPTLLCWEGVRYLWLLANSPRFLVGVWPPPLPMEGLGEGQPLLWERGGVAVVAMATVSRRVSCRPLPLLGVVVVRAMVQPVLRGGVMRTWRPCGGYITTSTTTTTPCNINPPLTHHQPLTNYQHSFNASITLLFHPFHSPLPFLPFLHDCRYGSLCQGSLPRSHWATPRQPAQCRCCCNCRGTRNNTPIYLLF